MTTPDPAALSDEQVARMERDLFARIAAEPRPAAPSRARRGRVWLGALGGAAAIALAVLVLPAVVAGSGGGASSSSAGGYTIPDSAVVELNPDGSFAGDAGAADAAAESGSREVIASGTATVAVDDVAEAIGAIGSDAEARGGYVESTSTDGGTVTPIDDTGVSYPAPSGPGYITVRVPSDELAAATSALAEVGEVTASSVSRQDVTDQAIDLRARVSSLEASVDRLTALVAEAQSVADVVAVEAELSARQADLASYRQQLEYLEGQVSLSTLSVTLTTDAEPVSADPAGFGDGLATGWSTLVATVNGLVVAVGFLLPWLVVGGLAALVVWLVVRARRRRAAARDRARTDAEAVDREA